MTDDLAASTTAVVFVYRMAAGMEALLEALAASGGVHTAPDAIQAILAGAHAVQAVSALLKKGPSAIPLILSGLEAWMAEYGYTQIEEFRGALNHARCPDPAAFERANYIRILQSWKV
jgi:dihydroorotate dehydrogenase (fumarate)